MSKPEIEALAKAFQYVNRRGMSAMSPLSGDYQAAERILDILHGAGFLIVRDDGSQHIIELRDDGWTIAHPLRERLDLDSLFSCSARWIEDVGLRGRLVLEYDEDQQDWVVGDRISPDEVDR